MPMLGDHPLDQPVWNALGTRQARFNISSSSVRRFPADVALFAAVPDSSDASYAALAAEIPAGVIAALLTREPILQLPGDFDIVRSLAVEKMVATTVSFKSSVDPARLGTDDVPSMSELVARTNPGPFGPRTIELGAYIGIKSGQRLLAMAGERMKIDGFTEISAVCTDPDVRGRGYARQLIQHLCAEIVDRDEIPFLHVVRENTAAISLYETLGFRRRTTMHFTVFKRAA
jgi:ribosomal protein S18 acetylase RimI-like enzyme